MGLVVTYGLYIREGYHEPITSADRQFSDLGLKIDNELQPVFTGKKIIDDLCVTELKPPLVNS